MLVRCSKKHLPSWLLVLFTRFGLKLLLLMGVKKVSESCIDTNLQTELKVQVRIFFYLI